MADNNKIEIEVSAKGGDQAASEVRKVTDAEKELSAAEAEAQAKRDAFEARRASGEFDRSGSSPTVTGFGGMNDVIKDDAEATRDLADANREAADAEKKFTEARDALLETFEERADAIEKELDLVARESREREKQEAAEETAANTRAIRNRQLLEQFSRLGDRMTRFGGEIAGAAEDIAKFDPELAEMLTTVGRGTEVTGSFIASIATGAAVAGPWGAAIGGASEAAKTFATDLGEAAAAAEEMESKSSAAFDALVEKLGKVAGAKASVELKTWLATLDDEEAAITRQNQALERNRELIEAKAEAQAKLDAARAQNEMAAIDADPSLSEAEKVRRKGAVREGLERKTLESDVNRQGRDVAAADEDARAKQEAASRAEADARAIRERKEADDREREQLERNERQRKTAEDQLPGAAAATAAATRRAEWLRRVPFMTGPQEEAERQQENLEGLRNRATSTPREAARLEELRKTKEATDAAARKAEEDAAKAREEAERARLDAENKRRILEATLPVQVQTYQEQAAGRASQTNTAAAAAEKRAQDKAKADKDRADREAEKERVEGLRGNVDDAQDRLDRDARRAGLGFRQRGLKTDNETLSQIGRQLSDGTNADEIQKIGDMVKEKQGELGKAMVDALSKVLESLEGQAAEIAVLKGQIKNRGGGTGR